MPKKLGFVAAVIAFLALAVVFIQREGEKTRESINDAGEKIADEIEKHMRSHPPATERVRRLEKLELQ